MTWKTYRDELIKLGYENEAIEKVKAAFEFAEIVHKSEKRLSGDPYIVHPIEVSLSIARLKIDTDTILAALLHDVIENQGIKIEDIKKKFGSEVAFLVDSVTKVDRIKYHGIERTIESLRKMFLALAEDIRVVLIKLMDRLHNMKTLKFLRPDKQQRIAIETLELYAPLADRLGMWEAKAELEDLAFPYVFPEEFKWLKEEFQEKQVEGEKYIISLMPILEEELKKEKVKPIRILYRVKNMFSIWQKLVKYEMNISKIRDLVAMRIIVNSLEDCYQTLGVIHKLWRPIPGNIKDYIALPKPNGYQSLHTTVFGPNRRIVEFQIRTTVMDEEAERGIAAHWAYKFDSKSAGAKKVAENKKFRWISQLQDWHKNHRGESPDSALSALKIDLFQDRIFVLTPKGDVFDLPENSSPIDFAYHVHSDIGDHMFGAKVDGKLVPFSYGLNSGETVEILTQKNKKPTGDWLDFAKTSLARNRIRSYLRKSGIKMPTPGGKEKQRKNTLEATLIVRDRVGILKDITQVFTVLKINLSGVNSDFKNTNFPKITLIFPKKRDLSTAKILTELKKIDGVETVAIGNKKS